MLFTCHKLIINLYISLVKIMKIDLRKNAVLTAAEMAAVDAYTIQNLGLPGMVLMERAGVAIAGACRRLCPDPQEARVAVLCGPGNNGGDGFVAARHLRESGYAVEVYLLTAAEKLRGDARLNLEIYQKLGHAIHPFTPETLRDLRRTDLIVDALLGTGAKGNLRDPIRRATQAINASPARVLAVDIPTGVDATTAAIDDDAVRATATVTIGARKTGLLFSPARECTGELIVADIGFPRQAFEHVAARTFLLDDAVAASLLPQRPLDVFKNRCGQILIIAGSIGMDGAAALCSKAALHAGAGLVILATPAPVAHSIGAALHEVMKLPLPEIDGMLAPRAWEALHPKLAWASVVALGPGLGQNAAVAEVVEKTVAHYPGVLVIDADGLNALAGKTKHLAKRPGPTILTPHPGEFVRLSGVTKEAVHTDPVGVAREFAVAHGVHLLLKGAPSLAVLPDGRVFINAAGNPGMATAGMGDVLTGVIAGLAGQMPDPAEAMLLGMFAHSRAGDLATARTGQLALTAGRTLEALGAAFLSIEQATKQEG